MGLLLLVLCAILIVLLQVTTLFEVVELRRKNDGTARTMGRLTPLGRTSPRAEQCDLKVVGIIDEILGV